MNAFLPYITALASACFYAVLPVLAKKMHTDIPPFAFIALTMAALSLSAFAASLIWEKDMDRFLNLPPRALWGVLCFGLINFVAFALYMHAIIRIPVAEYQMIYTITPLLTGLLALFILSEPFKTRYLLGLVFIVLGLYIALNPPAIRNDRPGSAPAEDRRPPS